MESWPQSGPGRQQKVNNEHFIGALYVNVQINIYKSKLLSELLNIGG